METKKIALDAIHRELGAKMVPFAGFEMPVRYSSDKEEHLCVREKVGIFDVSHMGEFFLRGPKALDLIQKVCSNDASKLKDGQAQYSCLPNEQGGIVDDLIVYKIKDGEYMLVVNASNIEKDWNWISQHNRFGVEMENESDNICLFAVQGPKAQSVLQKISPVALDSIPFYHFTLGEMGSVKNVIISATGYTGAGGFELYVDRQHAEGLWNAVMKAGQEEGIQAIGLGARDTLRLEMGYCLYGNDINDETSPLEAGLGWITKFTKDFINAEALKKQKEAGVQKRLVGFEMLEKGIPRQGYPILNEKGENIGEVTSGSLSPCLDKGVGLGYLQVPHHEAGSEHFIQIRNKTLKMRLVKLPIYKGS